MDKWIKAIVVCFMVSGCSPTTEITTLSRPVPADVIIKTVGASMVPYFDSGEWVGLLMVSYSSLQPGQSCVRWQNETGQYVHHFTYQLVDGGWKMRAANGQIDVGIMTQSDFIGRTVKLPHQPKF